MDELESLVNVALADSAMELEIRLGKIAFGRFCTDVPSSAWNLVKRRLESNKKWSRTETQSFVDEHFDQGHVRRRTFSDGQFEIIRKERIVAHDVPMSNMPMDLRISLSKEHRVDGPIHGTSRKETKTRHRFVHKDLWAFELTEIEGPRDIDSESSQRYQIEIEFLPMGGSQKYPCKYLADYGKLLAQDVLEMMKQA